MSEVRLQCPGCGTQYRLPEGAVPQEGRQVECTSCDHVWLAFPTAIGASAEMPDQTIQAEQTSAAHESGIIGHEPPSATVRGSDALEATDRLTGIPPLEQRIPENVLNILREEVEFERRARERNITENSSELTDHDSAEQAWPATTVTDAALATEPYSAPDSAEKSERMGLSDPAVPAPQAAVPLTPQRPRTGPAPDKARNVGYRLGFGTAVAAAVAGTVLYVIAPDFSPNDRFGAELSQYREFVDAGRDWLSQQISRLTK